MPHPDRDYIEAQLTRCAAAGLIKSWKPAWPAGHGAAWAPGARKWDVTLNPGDYIGADPYVISQDRDGDWGVSIRTYQEGKLFCAALASAGQVTDLPATAKVALQAGLRAAIDKMEAAPGSYDAEHFALYSLATCVAELLDVSFDSYVSTTDTGEDDDDD